MYKELNPWFELEHAVAKFNLTKVSEYYIQLNMTALLFR